MLNIGIVGYGNIGKAVELIVTGQPDMKVFAIFTRRPVSQIMPQSDAKVFDYSKISTFTDSIDLLILCGGSATDLPQQAQQLATEFNIVDSYDNHSCIPEYFKKVNEAAKQGGKTAAVSIGWDPGIFSLARTLFDAVLPKGSGATFWGRGVSQGHGDAIRRIPDVLDAVQYTVPKQDAIEAAKEGRAAELKTREKHMRECYVVAKEGADTDEIKRQITTMPAYFADYDTIIYFIDQKQLNEEHKAMPHGGNVFHSGVTGKDNNHSLRLEIKLDSNPEFTASVLVAYARAVARLSKEQKIGAFTILDIPMAYISAKSEAELLQTLV